MAETSNILTHLDFFDTHTHVSQEQMRSEIMRSIVKCAPGPHAFLILLKVERYTAQEEVIVRKITQTFGEVNAVVLFTHGDNLDEGQTIREFVRKSLVLQKLVDKCGGRCHVIDNKYWKQQKDGYRSNSVQVERLMKTIDEMREVRYERCYTNEMLQDVQRNLNNEMQVIRAESKGRWSEKQIRAETEERVHAKLKVRLAGVTTGALLGALLGVKRFVCSVMKKIIEHDCCTRVAQTAVTVGLLEGAEVVVAGVQTGVAVVGALKRAQTAYDSVEGEQTISGAINKVYQAFTNEKNVFGRTHER